MTDEQNVIFLGRKQQEPEEILVWNGAVWVSQSNPRIMVTYPTWITVPTNSWNTNIPTTIAPVPQFTEIDSAAEPEKKKHSDGYICKKCETLYPHAEPNQDDGTLVCYACRHGL